MVSVPGERTRPWALLGFLMPLAAGALVSMIEAAARPALAAFALCCISLVATNLIGAGELNLAWVASVLLSMQDSWVLQVWREHVQC